MRVVQSYFIIYSLTTCTCSRIQCLICEILFPLVKRGRGRPRRYPRPSDPGQPMPTFVIPSSGGKTIVMAPRPLVNMLAATTTKAIIYNEIANYMHCALYFGRWIILLGLPYAVCSWYCMCVNIGSELSWFLTT